MLKEKMRKFVTTRKEVYKEKTKTSNRNRKREGVVLINKTIRILQIENHPHPLFPGSGRTFFS